jgi:hypothetical protein
MVIQHDDPVYSGGGIKARGERKDPGIPNLTTKAQKEGRIGA